VAPPPPSPRLAVYDGIAPERELAAVGALLAAARDRALPPTLTISRLTGDATAPGRFQPASGTTVRRHTGGPACRYGAGQVSACLVVPDLEAAVGVPFLDKIVNRCVRGCIQGLAALSLRAVYGGRDHLVANGRRVALVALAAEAGGPCLFQAVLGLEAAPAPAPGGPGSEGPPWAALADLSPGLTFGRLAEALAAGYRADTSVDLDRAVTPPAAGAPDPGAPPAGPDADPTLTWGAAEPVPIGTVSAGLRLGPDGAVEALALAGEAMLDDGAAPALATALRGERPTEAAVTRAVEAVFADPARHVALGVPDRRALVRAVLAAATLFRSSRDAVRV